MYAEIFKNYFYATWLKYGRILTVLSDKRYDNATRKMLPDDSHQRYHKIKTCFTTPNTCTVSVAQVQNYQTVLQASFTNSKNSNGKITLNDLK